MPEFLAIRQTDASLLGCLLRRLAGKVSLGGQEPAAGVGFFQTDDLLVRKRPLNQPPLPEKLAEGVESEAALVCSGAVGPKAFSEQRTLPFRFKRWLFTLAGQADALAPVHAALVQSLPDYLRRAAKGDSAAEALFFLFLAKLREAGKLDDFEVDAALAARSLGAAVGEAERALEKEQKPLPPIAAVATNGRVMIGLRRGHPLRVGAIDGLIPCTRCEIDAASSDLDPRVNSHRIMRAAMLVSGAQEQALDGFRELNEGEIVAIPHGLVDVQSL